STAIYTPSLHDALPICYCLSQGRLVRGLSRTSNVKTDTQSAHRLPQIRCRSGVHTVACGFQATGHHCNGGTKEKYRRTLPAPHRSEEHTSNSSHVKISY